MQYDLFKIHRLHHALAAHPHLHLGEQRQLFHRAFGAQLIHDANREVEKDDAQKERVLIGPREQHKKAERKIQQIKQREYIFADNLQCGFCLGLPTRVVESRLYTAADFLLVQSPCRVWRRKILRLWCRRPFLL